MAEPVVPPSPGPSSDLGDIAPELRNFSARAQRIEDQIREMGAAFAAAGVKDAQTKLLKAREEMQGDLKSFSDYLSNVSNQLAQVVEQSKIQFEGNLKEIALKQEEFKKSIEDMVPGDKEREKIEKFFDTFKVNAKTTSEEITKGAEEIQSMLIEQAEASFKSAEQQLKNADKVFKSVQGTFPSLREDAEKAYEEALKNFFLKQTELDLAKEQSGELLKNAFLEKQLLELKNQELALSIPLVEYDQKRVSAHKEINRESEGVLNKLLNTNAQTGLLSNMLFSMATGNVKDSFVAFGKGLEVAFLDPQKAAARFVNYIKTNLYDSTMQFNSLLAEVNKNTGGFGEGFQKSATVGDTFIYSGVTGLYQYGLGLKEASKSYEALSKNLGNFNNLLDSQRKLLMVNATELTRLGVSAETYSRLSAVFMGNFRMGASSVSEAINKISRDAITLGKDVGQYASDLSSLMGKITGFGRDATQIFKELTAFSQATAGTIQATDLAALSAKFDTFDEAAQSIAKLNMMLGGTSVNITEMMRLDPAERIMKIKEAVGQSGVEFDKLNIGYKRFLAEFFGGDMVKTAAFFNAKLSDAQELMNKQLASEEELEKRKKASASAQDKLNAAIDNMKIAFTPIIEVVSKIADIINFMNEAISPLGTFLLGLGVTIGSLIFAVARFTAAFSGGLLAIRTQIAGLNADMILLNTQMQLQAAGKPLLQPHALAASRTRIIENSFGAGGGGAPGMGMGKMLGLSAAFMALPLIGMAIDSSRAKKVEETSPVGAGMISFNNSGIKVTPVDEYDDVHAIIKKTNISSKTDNSSRTDKSSFLFSTQQAAIETINLAQKTTKEISDLTTFQTKKQQATIFSTADAISSATSNISNISNNNIGMKGPVVLKVSIPDLKVGERYQKELTAQVATDFTTKLA